MEDRSQEFANSGLLEPASSIQDRRRKAGTNFWAVVLALSIASIACSSGGSGLNQMGSGGRAPSLAVSDPNGGSTDDGSSTSASGGAESTDSTNAPDDSARDLCEMPDVNCGGFAPGSVGYYLLSNVEYVNSVRELVGDVTFSEEALRIGRIPGVIGPGYIDAYETGARIGAEEAAGVGAPQREALLACDAGEATGPCVQRFIAEFATRAWRKPLSLDEQAALMTTHEDALAAGNEATAFQALLVAIFASPNFFAMPVFGLRHEANEDVYVVPSTWTLAPYEMASRLSYWLWQEPPDDELLEAAGAGGLIRIEEIQAHVRRMMNDDRFSQSLDSVHAQWLRADRWPSIEKDPEVFPEFTQPIAAAMAEQALAFTRSHLNDAAAQSSQWEELFLGEHSDGGLLSGWYEDPPGGDSRQGLLTLPGVLASTSGSSLTSPVRRGLFVRHLLCEQVPAPPPDIPPDDPRLTDPTLSTHERYAGTDEDETCSICHQLMNPLGYLFEHYDAIGKYRTSDVGMPIDATGRLVPLALEYSDRDVVELDGVDELSRYFAGSGQGFACLGNRWLEHARVGRACSARSAALATCSGGDVRELIVNLVTSQAFRFVAEQGSPSSPTRVGTCAQSGVMDCEVLTAIDGVGLSLEECSRCQGALPGEDAYCDHQFPFADVAIVRGCCNDEDCDGLAPFCGRHTAPNGICVASDAI